MSCLKCGGTGITAAGERCSCGAGTTVILPTSMKVPLQYQNVVFDREFVRSELGSDYGSYMEDLKTKLTGNTVSAGINVLICAPANSGKTVWAYTVYGLLYSRGTRVPELVDLMQARELILNYYQEDRNAAELLSNAPVAVIKLPMDLPNKFSETISTIIERRVRNNGSTIFLFNGEYKDIEAQDRFGKMKYIVGDGSFNSLLVKSFK